MNKVELIEQLAEKEDITKKDATSLVETLFDLMEEALLKGDDIKISGFGNLTVTSKKARTGIDPNTQEKIVIPSTKTLTIKTSKILKSKLNNN